MNIFLKDLRQFFSNKRLILVICVILVMVCTFICTHHSVEYEKDANLTIGVSNEDDSKYSSLLIDFFNNNDNFSSLANVKEYRSDDIEEEFNRGNIDAFILIPENFADSLMYLENIRIKVRINQEKEAAATVLKNILASYEKYVSAVQFNSSGMYELGKKSGLTYEENNKINMWSTWKLINKVLDKETYFDYREVNIGKIDIVEHYLYIFVYVIIMFWGIYVGIGVKKEQMSGVLKIYKVVGASGFRFIFSKVTVYAGALGAFLAIPMLIGSIIGLKIFNFSIFLITIITAIAYILFFITMALLIHNIYNYVLFSNMFSLLLIIMGGGIIPINFLPDNFIIIARILPIEYFKEKCKSLLIGNFDNKNYLYNILAILVMVITANIVFRKRESCE